MRCHRRPTVAAVLAFASLAAFAAACADRAPGPGSPAPTVNPTATVTPTPTEGALATLQPDGIGDVAFGEPVDTALPVLVERLGPPEEERSAHDPDLWGYLSESLDVDGRIRLVRWGPLTAVFLDRSGAVPAALIPFAAWTMNSSGGGSPALTTAEGVGLGSTRADLEAAYGELLTVPTEPGGPCGIDWVFSVDDPAGEIHGTFEAEPVSPDVAITALRAGAQPSC